MRAYAIPLILLAACGSSSGPAKSSTTPEPAPAATDPEMAAMCQSMFVRQRDCTDEFIPALVELRVRLDVPAGIAAEDQERGRDALVAQAMEEWKTDSTDEAIAAKCQTIPAGIPPEQMEQMRAQVTECMAAEACDAFVGCMMPIHEGRLRAAAGGAAH